MMNPRYQVRTHGCDIVALLNAAAFEMRQQLAGIFEQWDAGYGARVQLHTISRKLHMSTVRLQLN
jgi:hypothetical protein